MKDPTSGVGHIQDWGVGVANRGNVGEVTDSSPFSSCEAFIIKVLFEFQWSLKSLKIFDGIDGLGIKIYDTLYSRDIGIEVLFLRGSVHPLLGRSVFVGALIAPLCLQCSLGFHSWFCLLPDVSRIVCDSTLDLFDSPNWFRMFFVLRKPAPVSLFLHVQVFCVISITQFDWVFNFHWVPKFSILKPVPSHLFLMFFLEHSQMPSFMTFSSSPSLFRSRNLPHAF